MNFYLSLAVMAGVTYLIRMLPFAFFRHKIESRFIRSFLDYVPYAVLAAMTVPAVFSSAGGLIPSAVGAAAALALAWFDLPLIVVATAAALAAYLTGFFF
ncbi:MAG: AzlD domain-containing protein [Clostridiales bacterium]|nr:AzlD domain-containing protein [Clostridiales bacterium]